MTHIFVLLVGIAVGYIAMPVWLNYIHDWMFPEGDRFSGRSYVAGVVFSIVIMVTTQLLMYQFLV